MKEKWQVKVSQPIESGVAVTPQMVMVVYELHQKVAWECGLRVVNRAEQIIRKAQTLSHLVGFKGVRILVMTDER